jgi:hypothetical protein
MELSPIELPFDAFVVLFCWAIGPVALAPASVAAGVGEVAVAPAAPASPTITTTSHTDTTRRRENRSAIEVQSSSIICVPLVTHARG